MRTTQAKKYEKCVRPFYLGREQISLITGEVNFSTFEKRCGTRRKDLCEPCSVVWKDDAYFALMNGAKDYNGEITFITLTAPGWTTFGKAHTASHSEKKSSRCACRKFHSKEDPLVGLPLDKNNFEHNKVVEFNHLAPRLTSITLQKIWRLMATAENLPEKEVKRPTARVMEWQTRGLLHVHIIILGKVPINIVRAAVNGQKSTSARRINPTSHKGIRWGTQLDVKYANSKNSEQIKKLSGYITKVISYAVKDVTSNFTQELPAHNSYRKELRRYTNSVIKCTASPFQCHAADLGENPTQFLINVSKKVNLCRKHYRGKHQLGFTGNVLTLNRKWGSSLGAARKARQTFAKESRSAQDAAKASCLDTEKFLVTVLPLGRDLKKVRRLLAKRINAPTVERSGVSAPLLT
jgi:hypothetical protein